MDHKRPNLQKSLHGGNNKNDTKNENAHYQPFLCVQGLKNQLKCHIKQIGNENLAFIKANDPFLQ